MFIIALLSLLLALLAVLLLRPTPNPHNDLASTPLPPPHHYPSPPPAQPSPRSSPPPAPPRAPQPSEPAPVHQFGPLSPPPPDTRPSLKPPRRLSTTLRFPLPGKRRSSIHFGQADTHARSSPSPSSPPQSSPRTRFVNPFSKRSRSRTLSPSSSKSPGTPSSVPSGIPSPPTSPPSRRMLAAKFKSIFKSGPPEPSTIFNSKPLAKSIQARLRRKPIARTQPYGPPWNAPMPVPDFTPQHPLQKSPHATPPPQQASRKHSVHEVSLAGRTSVSSGQLSPRTFISELDEKLTVLQYQRTQGPIPSPHERGSITSCRDAR